MDFNFTSEQDQLRDTVARLVRQQYDFDTRRKVAKSEVRGRMAQMLLANWDKVDLNKNGFIDEDEMAPINAQMNGRIKQAQAQQSVGQ